MSRSSAKRDGEATEAAVIQRHTALDPVTDEEHVDARATAAITPSRDLTAVGLAVVEAGTPIEIKSCAAVVSTRQSRGRFYLRRDQHRYLVEAGAVYLFAVTPPHDHVPICRKLVPASAVETVVPGWIDPGPDRATYAQVTWSRVFDASEVERDDGTQRSEVSADV